MSSVSLVDAKGTVYPMKSGVNVLGRDWLHTPDKRLSRSQAELTVDGNSIKIKRLGVNPVKLKGSEPAVRPLLNQSLTH